MKRLFTKMSSARLIRKLERLIRRWAILGGITLTTLITLVNLPAIFGNPIEIKVDQVIIWTITICVWVFGLKILNKYDWFEDDKPR